VFERIGRRRTAMRKMAVSTARDKFTDVINEVVYTKEAVTLTRRGRPLAILIPLEQFELPEKLLGE
jgi:prevent-host-death family protein